MEKALVFTLIFMSLLSCKEAAKIEEVPQDGTTVTNSNGAPDIIDLLPSGVLPNSTGTVTLQVSTDEQTTCKFSQNNVSIYGMSDNFDTTDGLLHTKELSISEIKAYDYYVGCRDLDGAIAQGSNKISFIIDSNTTDLVPPNLYNAGPSADQPDGTTQVNLYANTNENANCRYSDDINHTYDQMSDMTTTGDNIHIQQVTGLTDGSSYTYFFICEDPSGNQSNTRGIAFSVSQFVLQDGLTLYANYCASCHGGIPSSEKVGATATRINNGINGVGSMNALEMLRASEIDNIVEALDY